MGIEDEVVLIEAGDKDQLVLEREVGGGGEGKGRYLDHGVALCLTAGGMGGIPAPWRRPAGEASPAARWPRSAP